MHPCTEEGQRNILPHVPKTERHVSTALLSASSSKGHKRYCKETTTTYEERYAAVCLSLSLRLRRCQHRKWKFS
ncbi:uncharacterized [Tachysurus ichikawai]